MNDASKRRPKADRDAQSRRRPLREKVQLRAALVLEEAGELLEAARLYEHAGEHDHAAALRLEHAKTVADSDEQLSALRQACAHAVGDGPAVAALHERLARVLADRAGASTDPASRRKLLTEQAQHLEHAGLGAQAGRIYEQLGDLTTAARAYQQAGAITELELVYADLDESRRQADAHRAIIDRIEHARRTGQRRLAARMLDEALAATRSVGTPALDLASERERLNLALLSNARCTLRWRHGTLLGALRICAASRLLIGRLPTADIPLGAPDLSREHAFLHHDGESEAIVVVDPGSRAGTFLDGAALDPMETASLTGDCELGLGLSTSLDLFVSPDTPSVLVVPPGGGNPTLFLPRGGPLRLTPSLTVAVHLGYREPFFELELDASQPALLNRQRLRAGTRIELLQGDVVELPPASGDDPITFEVHA